jgi:hypothetical protein
LLQNLARFAAGGLGALAAAWGAFAAAFAAARVSAPHFTQKTPLTGDPHLLQKFAMSLSPFLSPSGFCLRHY